MEQYRATVFAFRDIAIRIFVDEGGCPWFVAHDMRRALGHANPRRSVSTLTEESSERCYVEGLGRIERVMIISEYEAHLLVADAKTERRNDLLEWIVTTVTPAIRGRKEYLVPEFGGYYDDILHWFINNIEISGSCLTSVHDFYENYLEWARKSNICANSIENVMDYIGRLEVRSSSGLIIGLDLKTNPHSMDRVEFEKLNATQKRFSIKRKIRAARASLLMKNKANALREIASINAQLACAAVTDARENVVKFPSLRSVQID